MPPPSLGSLPDGRQICVYACAQQLYLFIVRFYSKENAFVSGALFMTLISVDGLCLAPTALDLSLGKPTFPRIHT